MASSTCNEAEVRQSCASCASTVGVAFGEVARTELADAEIWAQAAVGVHLGYNAGDAAAVDKTAAVIKDFSIITIAI